jgi:hypothetical protein
MVFGWCWGSKFASTVSPENPVSRVVYGLYTSLYWVRYVSMRTKIEPVELADAVYFLATDSAPHITGLMMEVSGGSEWEE